MRQSFRLAFELFRGSAGFKPVDFSLKVTPEFNINYLGARENNVVRIDPREGVTRVDTHVGFQEMYFETRFLTNSSKLFRRGRRDFDDLGDAEYDFTALRFGIQRFTSDFRGFVFSDEQPAARLFGTFHNNKLQYNLAYFNMLEKDTNSGLNRWRIRNQSVYIANLYLQDFPSLGYNVNFSMHYNNDQPSFHIDKNGFLVRPGAARRPAAAQDSSRLCRLRGRGPHRALQHLTRLLLRLRPRRLQPHSGLQQPAAHQCLHGRARAGLRSGLAEVPCFVPLRKRGR